MGAVRRAGGDTELYVRMPESLKKKLLPRRALPGTARPEPASKVLRFVAKTYASKPEAYWEKTHRELFRAGLETKKERTLRGARKAADALLAEPSLEAVARASLETLAVAEHVVWHMSSEASLTPAIAEAHGLPDAVRVASQAARLTTGSDRSYTVDVYIRPSDDGGNYPRQPCTPLRHLVCAAPDDVYLEARRCAEAIRKEGSFDDRVLLAYAFPDEPWGTADLDEALGSAGARARYHKEWSLLSATASPDVVRRWIDARDAFLVAGFALDLACVLPASEAIPIFARALEQLLVKPKYGPLHKTPPREVAQALACIGTEDASAILAAYANHPILGPQVLAYFREHRDRGAALEAQAKGKAKLEAAASRVLGKRGVEAVAVAKKADLPAPLRDAPWRTKAPRSEAIVRLAPRGAELEAVKLVRTPAPLRHATRDMTRTELAAWRKTVAKGRYAAVDYEHSSRKGERTLLRVPAREGLAAWNASEKPYLEHGALAWVERHGLATIPGFLARDWVRWLEDEPDSDILDAMRSLISPRVAPDLARVAARRKRFRRVAMAWLIEHAEVAAYGLVPEALGDPKTLRHGKESRADAAAALGALARQGRAAIVRRVAKRYGKEAEREIVALIQRDPLATDVAVPARPAFLRLSDLPPVKLVKGGRALDEDAAAALVEMLQISTVDDPYPGLAVVRDACTATSLGDFARELLEQWALADAPGRHDWMLYAVVHLPSEAATRRVAELAREWARRDQAKAQRACVALAAESSDLALMHLSHVAETTRFAALKKAAGDLVRDAAGARGLTPDELGDRTVPDVGLEPDGTLTLSYGARDFVVELDAQLAPVVRERLGGPGAKKGKGEKLSAPTRTLPRPTKTDDASRAKAARERFDRLKGDVAAIAQRQVRRLERAMVTARTWSAAEFEGRIARHPLLRHLARALVWEIVRGGAGAKTFRVAEDGTYADANDEALTLPAKASVRLAHPARTPKLADTWTTVFGDYAIVQPFEQLGRAVYELAPKDRKAKVLDRAAGITVPARKLLGTMESRGWQRDEAGYVSSWLMWLTGRDGKALGVEWPLDPGLSIEELARAPVVTTKPLVVRGADGTASELGALDPASFSEIVRDIEAVRALGP